MTDKLPPRRRHRVTVDIHADTFEELLRTVSELEFELRPTAGTSRWGGVSSGGHFEHTIDETQTAENYRAQLERWLAEKKNV